MLTLVVAPGGVPWSGSHGRLVSSWHDDAGHVFARAFVDGRDRRIDWPGLGVFSFTPDSTAIRVWPDPSMPAPVVQDMFARVVQPVVLQAMGWQALHASAVAGPEGAVAFCGVGHSGKSTIAYVVGLAPGFWQVADDAVVLDTDRRTANGQRLTRDRIAVVPLPFRPKLRNPGYDHLVAATGQDPHGVPTGVAGTSPIPLRTIFILAKSLTGSGRPEAIRLDAATAFRELLTHAHCFDDQDRGHKRQLLEAYLTIASAVPVYRVEYRPSLAELDALAAMVVRIGFSVNATVRAATPAAGDEQRVE